MATKSLESTDKRREGREDKTIKNMVRLLALRHQERERERGNGESFTLGADLMLPLKRGWEETHK